MFNLEVSLLYIICLFRVKSDTVKMLLGDGENVIFNNDTKFQHGDMEKNLKEELEGTGSSLEYENVTSAYQEKDNDLSPVYTYYYEDFVLNNGSIIYKPPPSHEYPFSPYYMCVQQVDHITPHIQLDIVCVCTKNPPEDNCCPLGHVIFIVTIPESTLYNCYMIKENLHNYEYWSMILYNVNPSFLLHNDFHCEDDTVDICNWNLKRDFIIITSNQPFTDSNGSLRTDHVHFQKDYICQDKGKWEDGSTVYQNISCAREFKHLAYYYTNIPAAVFYGLVLLILLILPETRNLRFKIIMWQTVNFLVMEIETLVYFLSDQELPKIQCYLNGYVRIFSGLAATFWINVLNIDMAWTLSGRRTHHSNQWKFAVYSTYAWGGSILITFLTVLFGLFPVPGIIRPEINLYTCWFLRYNALTAYYVGPALTLTIINGILVIYSVYKIVQAFRISKMLENKDSNCHVGNKQKTVKERWILFFNIALLVGTPRIFNFLPVLYDTDVVYQVLTFVGLFRSFLIFLLVCLNPIIFKLLKQRVHEWRRRLLRERVTCSKKPTAIQEGSDESTGLNSSNANTLSSCS